MKSFNELLRLGTELELGLPRGQLSKLGEMERYNHIRHAARQKSAMLDQMGEETAADALRVKYGVSVPSRAPVEPAPVVAPPPPAAARAAALGE